MATETLGDTNGDGTVNNIDAFLVLRFDVGLASEMDIVAENADVNRDGSVDSADASLILQYYVELIAEFPEVPKHTHNYTTKVVAPTCKSMGYTVYTCECGDSYKDDIVQITDHNWKSATCQAPKTCTYCGATTGSKGSHYYSGNYCIYCGARNPNSGGGGGGSVSSGQTWRVDGQWEITINSVTTHNLCNSYANSQEGYTNQQVVIVNYTYTNLGFDNGMGGLIFDANDFTVYGSNGYAGSTYACTHESLPRLVSKGMSCKASSAYVLDGRSSSVTVEIKHHTAVGGTHQFPIKTKSFRVSVN